MTNTKGTSNLIYKNYKEPLRANASGFGYLGTIAETKDGKYIQCYECGKLFTKLSIHIPVHNITVKEYRDKYEIAYSTPLASRLARERQSVIYRENISSKTHKKAIAGLAKYRADVKDGKRPHILPKQGSLLERKNKKGTCPDQLIDKLQKLTADNNGHIGYRELQKNHTAFLGNIIRTFGTLVKARKMANLSNKGYDVFRYSEEQLVEALRDFYQLHNRVPTCTDFKSENNLPNYKAYISRWGSINRARFMAGIPLIVQIGQHQFVEVTADEATKRGVLI